MGEASETTFGYADFGAWYDAYRAEVLEPSLEHAMDAIQRELDDSFSDRDLARIRSLSGRVKSKRRTWRKVNQPRYRKRINTVDDIALVIDDLIGMRLTCTNLRDIQMVQVALETLPARASKRQPIGLDAASERDYIERPKPSGYRGWHVNLGILQHGQPVTCELQVRTLLQDSWGELTHEDTYSKAGESPPLVEVLSTRMADLLATLDDIAEDLRNELDRIDEAIVDAAIVDDVTVGDSPGQGDEPDDDTMAGPGADAADFLLQRWNALDRPLELSSLAWALQREFGAEVSDDWFGYRTFKRFLRAAIPDGEISTGRRAYLLPAGSSAESIESDEQIPAADASSDAGTSDSETGNDEAHGSGRSEQSDDNLRNGGSGDDVTVDVTVGGADGGAGDGDVAAASDAAAIPDEAHALRRVDRGFPLLDTTDWGRLFANLADAWEQTGEETPSNRMVNQISRVARDLAVERGESLSRRHVDHVAKTVMSARESGAPLDAATVADVFTSSVLQRLAELRIVPTGNASARARIGRWLLG